MSQNYNMNIEVTGFKAKRARQVVAACMREWPFEEAEFCFQNPRSRNQNSLSVGNDGQLCGGETEANFVNRLASAVWRANGAFCEVTVRATYLEDLPYDTHYMDQMEYRAWRKRVRQARGKIVDLPAAA